MISLVATMRPGARAAMCLAPALFATGTAWEHVAGGALKASGKTDASGMMPVQLPDGFVRYIPAQPRVSASVIAIHAAPGTFIKSGRPMRALLATPP